MAGKTIKDLLEDVYRIMKVSREFIAKKEYPGKEIDTSYFHGMDDGIKEVFGRLDLYGLLDLPLNLAEELAKLVKSMEEHNGNE